jgi:DNA topoisomerase VI subunit B
VVKVDNIKQEPVIGYQGGKVDQFVKNGSSFKICYPEILGDIKERFLQMADDYTFLNPHLTLIIDQKRTDAIDPNWNKWRPNEPTDSHWYEVEHLTRLIGAYLSHDRDEGKDRTVREVVAEFRGLSSTAKQKKVLESTGLARVNLSALVKNDMVDTEKVADLLAAMKENTKLAKPGSLGVIGKENLTKKFKSCGCDMETFDYRKIASIDDEGLPFVVESAFGWFGENSEDERRFITGVNWSAAILNPFRELGKMGQSLDSMMQEQRAGWEEPIVYLLHVAYPRVQYTDRGKSALVISGEGGRDES